LSLKKQVQWRCRRGMLELDIILNTFFKQHYDGLPATEQTAFLKLLDYSDPELLAWFNQSQALPREGGLSSLIKKIIQCRGE